jgi:hypothetical protein
MVGIYWQVVPLIQVRKTHKLCTFVGIMYFVTFKLNSTKIHITCNKEFLHKLLMFMVL